MKISNIHRYLAGEASLEERKELERWLEISEENREIFESYRKIYDIKIQHNYTYDIEKALARFRRVMDEDKAPRSFTFPATLENSKKFHTKVWLRAAAIVLIAVSLSVYLFTSGKIVDVEADNPTADEVAGTTISTAPGEQKSFRLRDGSRVHLNADSEIHIPENFGNKKREVQLVGEAFFEVVSVQGLSFEVQTGTARVEVLGTSFSVRAWKEREESVVAVQTGKVSVRSAEQSIRQVTLLEAGQVSKIEVNKTPTPAREVNIDPYIGWTRQQFIFEDTPLRDVLKQLELHFNVTITVDDSATIDDPVTARYRNESLEEILEYTSITHGVEFNIEQPLKP